MLLFAALVAASVTEPATPDRQARATVRIVRVEPVRFGQIEQARPDLLRTSRIRDSEGKVVQARLLEYQ